MFADEDLHRHAVENLAQADALLFGRVTYEMMEAAWRLPAQTGARPDWMEPFARTIDAAKKYVVSSTLDRVDWNAELVRGDLAKAVQQLKRGSGKGLFVAGVKLPLALAELGLIDETVSTMQIPARLPQVVSGAPLEDTLGYLHGPSRRALPVPGGLVVDQLVAGIAAIRARVHSRRRA